MPHGEMDNSLWGNFMLTNWCFGGIMVETVVIFIGQRAVVDRLSSFVLC